MADSGNGISQATEEVVQAAGEVAKDVKDSVGQVLEQGVQSVAGPNLTPQQVQQKQQQEQQQLAETRRKIDWYKKIDEEGKRVRQENLLKEKKRLESQEQEKEVKRVQLEGKIKQPPVNPALAFAGKSEKKGPIGG